MHSVGLIQILMFEKFLSFVFGPRKIKRAKFYLITGLFDSNKTERRKNLPLINKLVDCSRTVNFVCILRSDSPDSHYGISEYRFK